MKYFYIALAGAATILLIGGGALLLLFAESDEVTFNLTESEDVYTFKGKIHMPDSIQKKLPAGGQLVADLVLVMPAINSSAKSFKVSNPKYPVSFELQVAASELEAAGYNKVVGDHSLVPAIRFYHCQKDENCKPTDSPLVKGYKIIRNPEKGKTLLEVLGKPRTFDLGDVYISDHRRYHANADCGSDERSIAGTVKMVGTNLSTKEDERHVLFILPLPEMRLIVLTADKVADAPDFRAQPLDFKNGTAAFSVENLSGSWRYYRANILNCPKSLTDYDCGNQQIRAENRSLTPPFFRGVPAGFEPIHCGQKNAVLYFYPDAKMGVKPSSDLPEEVNAIITNRTIMP